MTTQKFENNLFTLEVKTESGESLFDVETVAKSLGFTQEKSGKEYVRWETVNKYLRKYLSQEVGKNDFISESMVYKLAFKANNALAEKFQDWLAVEVIPTIRKHGTYSALPQSPREALKLMFDYQEETSQRVDGLENDVQFLKEDAVLSAGDYNLISERVNKRVSEVSRAYNVTSQATRGKLFKDINGGIKQITGVGRRTQLRKKHLDIVLMYINDWEPSTATKTIVRQMELELEEDAQCIG